MIYYYWWMLVSEGIIKNHKLDTTVKPLYATKKWNGVGKHTFNWWSEE